MTTPSISEIINATSSLTSRKKKIEFLRANYSSALRNIMVLTYDSSKVFLLPDANVPYTPSVAVDTHGTLFTQIRKLKYVVKGFSPDNIKQGKREQIFIEILESVHPDDAIILLRMIEKKPFKGINKSLVNEAFNLELE